MQQESIVKKVIPRIFFFHFRLYKLGFYKSHLNQPRGLKTAPPRQSHSVVTRACS